MRLTAYKVPISVLRENPYVNGEGRWEPNYVDYKTKKLSRVNIIARVVSRFINEDASYGSLVLDDGTSTIRLKMWKGDVVLMKDVSPGDLVVSVGKVRQWNDETYIVPEIIRVVENANYEILRKLELKKEGFSLKQREIRKIPEKTGLSKAEEEKPEKEEEAPSALRKDRKRLLSLIDELDKGDGAPYGILSSKVEGAEEILKELISEGEIFEPRPGKFKKL